MNLSSIPLSPQFTGVESGHHSRFGSKDTSDDLFNQQRGAANTVYTSLKGGIKGLESKNDERNLSIKHDKKVEMMLQLSKQTGENIEGVALGKAIPSKCGNYLYHVSVIDYL